MSIRSGFFRTAIVKMFLFVFILLMLSCASQGAGRDPDAAADYFRRSKELANDWDFQGALDAIERAIELDQDNGTYIMFKGTYETLLGDRLASVRALDKAIEIEPDNPRFYNNRAASLVKLGFYREAEKDIEKVIEIGRHPYVGASLDSLAWIHFFEGDFGSANEVLDRIETISPGGAVEILRFRIIQETEGNDRALAYGREVLNRGDEEYWTQNALRLLLGEVDLRDIEIRHVFDLSSYMFILKDYEFQLSTSQDGMVRNLQDDVPVILIRDAQTIKTDETLGPVVADIIRSSLVGKSQFRVVDNKSRIAALEEMEMALSDLTQTETDVELGRFLSADYILSGSLTSVEGQLFCNITITGSQTAEVLLSKFITAKNFDELTSALRDVALRLPETL